MALTWKGGDGNWYDANWDGTTTDSRVLSGSNAYTVTMQRLNGCLQAVTISNPIAMLQMTDGAWVLGAMTLMSGTLSVVASNGSGTSLPASLTTIINVGGTILVPTLASLQVKDSFSNSGQVLIVGDVLLGGTNDVNTGTIAIDQGVLRLNNSDGLAAVTSLTNAGTITLAHGGVLDDGHARIAAGNTPGIIRFLDQSGATLRIGTNGGVPFGSTIDSFQASNVIDLVTAPYDKQTLATYAHGVLSVFNQRGLVTSLNLTNIVAGATFAVASDGSGGTRITTNNQPPPPVTTIGGGGSGGSPGGSGGSGGGSSASRFVDDSLEAQAARLYNAAFGRAPDVPGLAFWSAALHSGVPLIAIAGGFLAGAEFQARYGTLDNPRFVDALYQNVLHRGADASGLAYWQQGLDSGAMTRPAVLASFSESVENKAQTPPSEGAQAAARLYYAAFNRAPDFLGLAFWTSQLSNGTVSLVQEADALAGSAEFVGRYGTLSNVDFVSRLYQNVLGRAADPAGLTAWFSALASGASRGSVVTGFSESAETKARFAGVVGQNGIVLA